MKRQDNFRKIPPAVTDFPPLSIQYPTVDTLSNGIDMHILEAGEQPVNRLTLSWEGGMTDTDNSAAMTLMALLLREGTVSYSGKEISETLDFNGAWLKVEPLSHNITVTLHSLNTSSASLLPLLAEIIREPIFPEKEIDAMKEKVAASAEISLKKVSTLASIANRKLTFGLNHPLATQTPDPVLIRRITRDDIVKEWEHTFSSNRPTIFIAGQTTGITTAIDKVFSSDKYPVRNGSRRKIIPFKPEKENRSSVRSDNSLQSAICMSVPTIPRSHPDYIDLRLAVMALGGYFGSRLMANIREDKGYTYGINAALLGYLEGGVITISCQTDPSYVSPLIEETLKEIDRLKSIPMDLDELTSLKRFAMSSLAATLDSPFSVMDHHINHLHSATPTNYFELQQKAISELTPDRISDVLAKHLDMSEMKISIAGPESGQMEK